MTRRYGIVVIGNEVLSGKVDDINSTWLMKGLRELGGRIERVVIIPDDVEIIAEQVALFARLFDVVFTSGGVGPTHDDMTFLGVARAFDRPLRRNAEMVEVIEKFFAGRDPTAYMKMADLPEGVELVWTPGMPFPTTKVQNVWILPGDPAALRRKFEGIRERFRESPFRLRRIYTTLEEGDLKDLMAAVEAEHVGLQVGSYPVYDDRPYRVQITLESKDAGLVEAALQRLLAAIPAAAIWQLD